MCIPQEYKVVWHDVLTNLLSLFCTCYLLFITFSMSHDIFHGWVTLDTNFSAHWPSHSSTQISQFYATQLNRSILCTLRFFFPSVSHKNNTHVDQTMLIPALNWGYHNLSSYLAIFLMEALWLSFHLYLQSRHVMSVTIMAIFVRLLHTYFVYMLIVPHLGY